MSSYLIIIKSKKLKNLEGSNYNCNRVTGMDMMWYATK